MIFNTFESDINSISSKFGILGRSFSDISDDIKKRWNDVSQTLQSTNDYTLRNIVNAWKTNSTSPITFLSDNKAISILNEYNKALDSGAEATAKFLNTGTENEFMDKFLKDLDGAPATMDKYKAATKKAAAVQKSFSISTIAAKAAVLALNIAVSVGLTLALSALAKVITEIVQSEENLKNSATELGSELENNSSSIEDYKKRIEDLKSILNSSSSSIEDVAQARINLMSIQDELIKKFGTEKVVIEDITEAINGQTEALDELSRDSYYKAVDRFNKKTFGEKIVDFITYGNVDDDRIQSNMEEMISQMESSVYTLETTGNEVLDELIARAVGLTIDKDVYGKGKHFTIYGSLDEIQEKLSLIRELSSDFDVSTGFENDFTEISNDVDTLLKSYEDLYNQYVLWEKILTNNPDNQYDEQYNLINKAKEAYDKALVSGDSDAIQKASEAYYNTLSSAIDLAMSNYDYDVADYFENMYPDMKQLFSEWKFTLDFEPNTDGLKDRVTEVLNGLNGMSLEDILAFNPNVATEEQIAAYGELNNIALEYGMTLKGLVDLLLQKGLIQPENYQLLVEKFGQDNIDKLTPEDLVFAYKIENIGDMSFEELQAEIQKMKDEASKKDKIELANIPDTITKLDSQLKPAFDSLKSAYQDIFTEDGFTLKNVNIDTFSGIQKAIDTFNELDGVTKITQETYEEFVKVISDSTSTEEDVQNMFNKLATEFINNTNVIYADVEAMNALKQSLEQMGVTNAEEVLNNIKSAQQEIIDAGYDLENMTNDDAAAFINLSKATDNAKNYLISYRLNKQLAEHPLNTLEDIKALEDLCGALNITGKLYKEVAYLKNLEMSTGIPPEMKDKLISDAQQRIQDALEEEYTVDFGFTYDGSKDENDNASKAAEKAASDLLDKLLALYEAELNNGLITFDEFVQKSKDTIEQFYKEGKIKAEDYWNYIHNLYEKQISYMDKVISAVTSKIDDEISDLEKKKESIEEIYNKQIESIQEEIDILEKANQKRKDAIDLQKALYALRRAENQRTNLVYKDGQMVYEADPESIREAQEEYDDKEYELKIKRLQEQIEELEKKMKEETDIIDEQIKKLNEYKEKWSEISSYYEKMQNEMFAKQILGANWESDILNGRMDVLEDFKNNYIKLQEQMTNAAWEAAKAQVEAAKYAETNGGSGGSGGTSGSGGNNGKTPTTQNSDDISTAKTKQKWYVYNGKKYPTDYAAIQAKQQDYNAVKKNTSIPTEAKEAQLKAIKNRKITTIVAAKGGVIGKDDDFLSSIAESVGEDTMVAVKEGERILTPIQNKNFEKLINIADKLIPSINTLPFANLVNRNIPTMANNAPIITINNPTFTCTGITGEEVLHEIESQFSGMFLNAYQQSMKK